MLHQTNEYGTCKGWEKINYPAKAKASFIVRETENGTATIGYAIDSNNAELAFEINLPRHTFDTVEIANTWTKNVQGFINANGLSLYLDALNARDEFNAK